MLNSRHKTFAFKYVLGAISMCLIIFYIGMRYCHTPYKEYILPSNEKYLVFEDLNALISYHDQCPVDLLPPKAKNIWVYCKDGFGYEDWQFSCIVSAEDFRRYSESRKNANIRQGDSFCLDFESFKVCNWFYQKRLHLSQKEVSQISESNRFVEYYDYDQALHWHIIGCYDRASNILSCDIGR